MKKIMLLLLPFAIAACGGRKTIEAPSLAEEQYAYAPLKIGQYRQYQVDSINYDFAENGGIKIDSITSFIEERVTDTLRDNTGALLYRVERYARKNQGDPWTLAQINQAARNGSQYVRTENNFRFLSLIFPMDRRSAWDGNLWIDENREIEIFGERMRPFLNWAYEVDSIDVPAIVGAFQFDSTLLVTEADDNNVIERRLSRARYAKQVGLVWKEQWILDSQYCNKNPVPADCETKPWEQKAEKGYILRQRIIAFN